MLRPPVVRPADETPLAAPISRKTGRRGSSCYAHQWQDQQTRLNQLCFTQPSDLSASKSAAQPDALPCFVGLLFSLPSPLVILMLVSISHSFATACSAAFAASAATRTIVLLARPLLATASVAPPLLVLLVPPLPAPLRSARPSAFSPFRSAVPVGSRRVKPALTRHNASSLGACRQPPLLLVPLQPALLLGERPSAFDPFRSAAPWRKTASAALTRNNTSSLGGCRRPPIPLALLTAAVLLLLLPLLMMLPLLALPLLALLTHGPTSIGPLLLPLLLALLLLLVLLFLLELLPPSSSRSVGNICSYSTASASAVAALLLLISPVLLLRSVGQGQSLRSVELGCWVDPLLLDIWHVDVGLRSLCYGRWL